MIQIVNGSPGALNADVTVRHNTMVFNPSNTGKEALLTGDTAPAVDRIDYVDNINSYGMYGIFGSGKSPGLPSINAYFTNWSMTHDAFLDANPNHVNSYPPGNWFYTTAQAQFTNAAAWDYTSWHEPAQERRHRRPRRRRLVGQTLLSHSRRDRGAPWALRPGDATTTGRSTAATSRSGSSITTRSERTRPTAGLGATGAATAASTAATSRCGSRTTIHLASQR